MKSKSINQKSINEHLLWFGVGLGALFWILESAIHAFIFNKGNFLSHTLPSDPNEIWMRFLVIALFAIFSFYAQSIINQRKLAEEMLRKQSHDLGERVKQVKCLYGISELVEKAGISFEDLLQGIVDLIPPAWQYPEITSARLILQGQIFQTNNFHETIWKQTSDIIVFGNRIGILEVCYLEEKPERDEGPFREEERNLLNIITVRLGGIVEHRKAREAQKEGEGRYLILAKHVADGVSLVQNGRFLLANNALASMFGYSDANQLIGKEAVDLISNDFKRPFHKLHEKIETGKSSKGVFCGTCISKDGCEIWIEGHYNCVKWEGKPAVLGTVRDITKTKLQSIAMREKTKRLREDNIKLRATIKDRYKFGHIVGKSLVMQEVYELIVKSSASDAGVVIYGESGTGKDLIARTIHDMSNRSDKAFVPVNCGAIPENLFESEFFGHRKGAFTGAHIDKHGFFDYAHEGTLFLDEVGELPLNMQVKLLRAIEGGEYTPVGDNKRRKADIRIIVATNRDLTDMVKTKLMREDFFYRIYIMCITVPPLRGRKEDIPLLIDHFLQSRGNGKKTPTIPGKIMDAFCNYNWPGNVRHLQNALHRYLIEGHLDFLNPSIPKQDNVFRKGSDENNLKLRSAVEEVEKTLIIQALNKHDWNRSNAAAELCITRKTLFRKLKIFGLGRTQIGYS